MQKNKENLSTQSKGDRFIPSKVHLSAFQVSCGHSAWQSNCTNYQELLGKSIFAPQFDNPSSKIMDFTNPDKRKTKAIVSKGQLDKTGTKLDKHPDKKPRKINNRPYKVLGAPNLQDDFYLNLLDWSPNNQIAVALDASLHVWSGCSQPPKQPLYSIAQISDYICSVKFCDCNKIAFGNSIGKIQIYDINKKKRINYFDGHNGRVGSLDWSSGLLASGSRDGAVATWDLRDGLASKYKAHSQQICGLKWSQEGNYIASGGNDNKLVVYSNKKSTEIMKFHQHKAAVKAIGWCPSNPSILTSGGGTADRHIRFFSTQNLSQTHSIDTGSQICNLVYSKISNQMITTHGYSLNQINLWNSSNNWQPKSVNKMSTLTGHTFRVLYLAASPSGQSILTGAGDETLRFWNVFDSFQYKKNQTLGFTMDLR